MNKHSRCFWLLAFLAAVGCNRQVSVSTTRLIPQETLERLKVHGAWSEPVNGLRCCILLKSDTVTETDRLEAVFVISNVADKPVKLYEWGFPPFSGDSVHWRIGEQFTWATSRNICATAYGGKARLQAGHLMVMGPVDVVIPATPGTHNLGPLYSARTGNLAAPPVPLHITAAEWGEPANGVRVRIAARTPKVFVGEAFNLTAFVHNMEHSVLRFRYPCSYLPEVTADSGLITVTCRPRDPSGSGECSRGIVLEYEVPVKGPSVEPGDYKLRVVIEAAPASTPRGECWHGRVASNVIPIRVVSR